jgi:hypothetical protein
MNAIFGREPAALLGLIQAGLALAVGFGLQLTGEQVALTMAFAAAAVAVITRQTVTPISDPRLDEGTTLNHGMSVVARVPDPGADPEAPHA